MIVLMAGLLLAPDAGAAVQPFEANSYGKLLHMSPSTAERDLEVQARAGRTDIVASLEKVLQSSFAGIYFDSATGEYVVRATSENSAETVGREMRAVGLANRYRTRVASHSWEDLEAAQTELNEALGNYFEAGLVYTSLDPQTNAVVLHVASDASGLDRATLTQIGNGVGAEIEVRIENVSRFKGARDSCSAQPGAMNCSAPLRGGVEISEWGRSPKLGGICTAGFRAVGANGNRYVITADHCNPNRYAPGEQWQAWDQQQLLKWNYWGEVHYLGYTEQVSSFPSSDWTKINATGTEWDTWNSPQGWPAMVTYWPKDRYERPAIDEEYDINAEAKSVVGQGVCHSGISSGTTCGEVKQVNVTYEFGEEGKGYGLVKVKGGCYEAGDSGGPFFAANVAYGIHIGSEDEHSPCTTSAFYHEITSATADLGVTIAGGKPAAETKSASNVSEYEVTLNGTVNPNGPATTYRFEYGTTTSYGESTPVPNGYAGVGTSPIAVGGAAARLEPGTTYHYRLVASNSGGTSYGSDLTFHTPGWRFMRGLSNGSSVSNWSTTIGMDLPPMATGDVNGDGKADVVSIERDNGLYRYKFGYSDGSGIASWEQVLTGMAKPTRFGVGDVTGDGKADIVAVEPEGGGKYRYMLGYGTGAGISSWSQVMSEMSYPHKLALGDLTGDGKADIVAVESQSNGQYRYMLGKSSGTGISSWSSILSNMAYAEFMDVGDFSADGKADVVTVENQYNGKFRFMLGLSNGAGIGSWSQVMSEMSGPYLFNLGDFTGDGKADIVSLESDGSGKYRYMLGTSNGSGVAGWSELLGGMGLAVRSDLGDLTGDGKADIVSVETESTGSYSYRLGVSSGSGVSGWNQIVSWMRTPREADVGDINGDGKSDVVSVESEGGSKYRYQVGFSGVSGIVSNWKTVLTGMGQPSALALGDLTGDGKADIVAVEPEGSGKYRYMLGTSSGTGISSWSSILTGMGLPTRMDLGDFSGDGKADIVAFEPDGSGAYRIMRGLSNGSGISSWSQVLGGLGYPSKAAVGDLTGDGKADVVSVESQGSGQYRYMLGKSSGSGISSWSSILSNMAYAEFMDLGDYNGDGKADIVSVENQGGGQFRFMLGTSNGAGIGSWSQLMGGMAGPYFFHLGDLNADGKADIVSAETM
jgi:hypothetical protein